MFLDNLKKFKSFDFEGTAEECPYVEGDFLAEFEIKDDGQNDYSNDLTDKRRLVLFQDKLNNNGFNVNVCGDKRNIFAHLRQYQNGIIRCVVKESGEGLSKLELSLFEYKSFPEDGSLERQRALVVAQDLNKKDLENYISIRGTRPKKEKEKEKDIITYPYAFAYFSKNEISIIGGDRRITRRYPAKIQKEDGKEYYFINSSSEIKNIDNANLCIVKVKQADDKQNFGAFIVCDHQEAMKSGIIARPEVPIDEFTRLWACYSEIEVKIAEEQAEKAGKLTYSRHRREGTKDVFTRNGGDVPEFTEGDYCEIDGLNFTLTFKYKKNHAGKSDYYFTLNKEYAEIPPKGEISLSVKGAATQKNRRINAQRKINENEDVRRLICNGEYSLSSQRSKPKYLSPVNSKINDEQKNAIRYALTTPNYAIIQGPPGTGKTKVIVEIIKLLHKNYGDQIKILLSSSQNVAVENICVRIDPKEDKDFELPAFRIKSQKGVEHSRDEYATWANGIMQKIQDEYVSRSLGIQVFKNWIHLRNNKPELLNQIQNSLDKDEFIDMRGKLEDLVECLRRDQIPDLPSELRGYVQKYLEGPDVWLKTIRKYCKGNQNNLPPALVDASLDETKDHETLRQYLRKYLEQPAAQGLTQKDLEGRIREIAEYYSAQGDNRAAIRLWAKLSNDYNVKKIAQKYAPAVASTCQMAGSQMVCSIGSKDIIYDWVIIDEAARSNPLDLMIPLSICDRAILLGDQKQLPQMIDPEVWNRAWEERQKDKTEQKEYKKSLFERMFDNFDTVDKEDPDRGITRTITLTTQYRMHSDICNIVSELFYDGELTTGTEVDEKCHHNCYCGKHLVWLDVNKPEEKRQGKSRCRDAEIDVIKTAIEEVVAKDDNIKDIGIITFYKAQADKIKDALPDIECGTVDAFQGREFDCVILSCVCSNRKRDIGFLANDQRLCVAFSRARKLLITVADSETVARDNPNDNNNQNESEKNDKKRTFKKLLAECKTGKGIYYYVQNND